MQSIIKWNNSIAKKEEAVKSELLTALYDTQLTATEIDGCTIIY